jgi:integrase
MIMSNKNKIYKKKFRKFLYEDEIEKVLELCKKTRFALRNEALLLITYNHAYRASEVCNLKWEHIDYNKNTLTVVRKKGGSDFIHPLGAREKELLILMKEKSDIKNPYVFTSEVWGTKLEPQSFYRLTLKLGIMAGFDFKFTPHMLRHAKGTFLAANDVNIMKIKNYLAHKRLSSTELYIHLAANQFKDINQGSMFM